MTLQTESFVADRGNLCCSCRFRHRSRACQPHLRRAHRSPESKTRRWRVRDVRVRFALYGAAGRAGRRSCRAAFPPIVTPRSTADGNAGWWNGMVGHGSRDRYAIASACSRSTGSICDLDDPRRPAFAPSAARTRPMRLAALLVALGIDRVHAFVGASYGAMVGTRVRGAPSAARASTGRDRRRASRASARDRAAQSAARNRAPRRTLRRRGTPASIWRAASR